MLCFRQFKRWLPFFDTPCRDRSKQSKSKKSISSKVDDKTRKMTIADIMRKSTGKAKSRSTVKVSILTEVEEDDVALPAINNEFEDCCGSDNCGSKEHMASST